MWWMKASAKRLRWGGRDRCWSGFGGALGECMVLRLNVDSPVRWTPVPVEEGFSFVVGRVGRRRNAAPMFWYAGRRGEREGLGKRGAGKFRWLVLEVRLRGFDFFSEGFRSYICTEGKNDEKNPHPPTYRRPYEDRRGIW